MDGGQGNGGVQVACEGHEVGIEENKLRVPREGIQANKWSKNTKIMIMESMCANSIVIDVRDIYVICFVHSDQKLCLHFEVVDRNK